jgi:hypothetical protein
MDGPVSNAPIARVTLPKSVSASSKYKMRTISNMHGLRRDRRAREQRQGDGKRPAP